MGKPGKDADLTYAEMEKVAGDLIKDMHDLEDKIKNIEKRVGNLVEQGFTTQKASGAYDDSVKEFTKGAAKTIHGLHGLSSFLKKAKEAYEQLDEQLAQQAKH
ncbi:WXG100 family type VII secretion target [Streptomyces sp. L2]|jgi:WXG100 family type VII secretion target|uniref:WXG100 family type VII secretion target n=1 Tax=Streptomyces sp. L2 TaxID=2162665 RepID=UPI001F510F38|nr:WXG100 family type VII secretion target [Streptomyces sp. L2]